MFFNLATLQDALSMIQQDILMFCFVHVFFFKLTLLHGKSLPLWRKVILIFLKFIMGHIIIIAVLVVAILVQIRITMRYIINDETRSSTIFLQISIIKRHIINVTMIACPILYQINSFIHSIVMIVIKTFILFCLFEFLSYSLFSFSLVQSHIKLLAR